MDENQEERFIKRRFTELAERSYNGNQYTFTDFLNMSEITLLYQSAADWKHAPFSLFGGMEDCERQMARFGSPEMLGYEMPFPIVCIKIMPMLKKFADDFTHRDFLGAIMNLGIERSMVGDIITSDREGYVFCTEKIAPYIQEHLGKVRHTHVRCEIIADPDIAVQRKWEESEELVASERIDGIIAKIYRLSRSQSLTLFQDKKIFVNSRLCENNAYLLKNGDIISVRGFGKMIYEGIQSQTKKEKLRIRVKKYSS